MKEYIIPTIYLPMSTFNEAMDTLFDEQGLKRLYGDSLQTTVWEDNLRHFSFDISAKDLPRPFRKVATNGKVKISVVQTLKKTPTKWVIQNKMQTHVMMGNLIDIEPNIELHRQGSGSMILKGRVYHRAHFMPPIRGFVENVLLSQTRAQMVHYIQSIQDTIDKYKKP